MISLRIQQWMMKFLRKRGWVVFYLEEEYRECKQVCWLKLYLSEIEKENRYIPTHAELG